MRVGLQNYIFQVIINSIGHVPLPIEQKKTAEQISLKFMLVNNFETDAASWDVT